MDPDSSVPESPADLTRDDVFFILSNSRRRYVIQYLAHHGKTDIRDLYQYVASHEMDVEPVELTYNQRKRAYTSLYQVHLPKLAEHGIIDYDKDRGTIQGTDRTELLFDHLDDGDRWSRPWNAVYGGLSGLGLTIGVGMAVDLPPVAGLSPVDSLIVLSGAVGLATLARRITRAR